MALPIKESIVPENHPIRSHQPMHPLWITIHETANTDPGANAEMHDRYLRSQEAINREVLWHATVDQDQIIHHLPWTEVGWHAGDGLHGPGNTQSIGIELCVNVDGDFEKTKHLAAQLVAYLIHQIPSLKPFPECVVQHNHWSGKDCPHQIRATPGAWEAFLAMCKQELDQAVVPAEPDVTVLIDGQPVEMHARLEGDTTRVDLRALAEALGAQVTWIPPEQGGPKVEVKTK
jgi:N-acetylmuramoyl-L-alanine amidase